MEVSEEVLDFERGECSGVAWMVGEFYMNLEDRINDRATHVCTEKFKFIRATVADMQQLRDLGYGVKVNN